MEVPALPFGSYNISLNLSSIFYMLPGSRLLARLRRGAYESRIEASGIPSSSVIDSWTTEVSDYGSGMASSLQSTSADTQMDQLPAIPGPWGFFTSGYMLGLFVMAILLHRMQNVIIPSRAPAARRARHAYRFGPTFATSFSQTLIPRRLFNSILPLNFSRTTTRLALHLPSIYFLSKMLLLWLLLVLQTSEIYPSFTETQKAGMWGLLGRIEDLGKWSSQKGMDEICWGTFCAVCLAFLVEGFVKALDGIGSGFPIGNVNPNTSPFNLVGYAFLLHIYSSPIAHAYKPDDGTPSRPDKHVIITIAIPLLQLTAFHILSVSKRLSVHRLLPTALTSFLSLAHFHGTLFSHFFFASPPTPSPSVTTNSNSTTRPFRSSPFLSATGKGSYPLLNYIPNIFETLLIGTILLTIVLNAIAQLLVRGRVDRLFSGLGVGSGTGLRDDDELDSEPGFFQSLPFEEDFGVLLLRVGTASLEATGLRGWGNEVAPIRLPVKNRAWRRGGRVPRTDGGSTLAQTFGSVRMGRMDVGEVQYGSSHASASTSTGFRSSSNPNRQQQRGFLNEVRTVDLGNADSSRRGGNVTGSGWWRWVKAMGPFLVALWDVLKGLVVLILDRARSRGRVRIWTRQPKAAQGRPGLAAGRVISHEELDEESREGKDDEDAEEVKRMAREKEVYARFLRGEDISDDDEGSDGGDEGWLEEEEDDGEDEEQGQDNESEAMQLFTDLLRNGRDASGSSAAAGGSGEMVLAHLMHGQGTSPGPLTRRRWNALVSQGGFTGVQGGYEELDDDAWSISNPGIAFEDEGGMESQRKLNNACVICTNEGRDIICWPCRCLAMCDGCREALASRSAPTKHRCPCCRQTVEGYSRIYIP
ncbi:hypothetical protein B0H34DRAFT_650577 [Crassisporium funariophilum]|nr:hypothetical protein B0H34DRAFT_650577 [Crassisporium funariophilum]